MSPFVGSHIRRAALAALTALVALTTLAVPDAGSAEARGRSDCTSQCVFVLDRGRYETVKLPFRELQDIVRFNNRGDIVGAYVPEDPPNDQVDYRGYLRDRRGKITLIDVPGAVATTPNDINDRGEIVGSYADTPDDVRRGFLRDRHGGYRTIHPPGAVQSQAFAVNGRGEVVGEYLDASGTFHGYLWRKGRFSTFDAPESAATAATDVNDRGQIVGIYLDATGSYHGFQHDDGRYATFDVPFGQQFMFPPAINNRGQVVGTTYDLDADGQPAEAHGYLMRAGVGGPVTRIDVPGADQTGAFAISDQGRIIGLYGSARDAMGDALHIVGRRPDDETPRSQAPAFVADRGHYRSFEAPDPDVQLAPGGITDRGEIVGEYITPTREIGFRRDTRGRITTIDLPSAAGTQVDKINDRGQIVGCYSETSPFLPAGPGTRGYLLDRGRLTRIDVPGAASTVPHGINDHGQVVGVYEDADGKDRGFRWAHGRFVSFDVPGAVFTEPTAINDRGEIVGIYGDAAGTIHGFMLRNGVYTTIDAPGAVDTVPFDINDRGHVVGSSLAPTADDPLAGARGFVLRKGVDGPFEEVRFPGAPRTLATGIDDRGRIVGIYENPNPAPSAPRNRAADMPLLDVRLVGLAEAKETA